MALLTHEHGRMLREYTLLSASTLAALLVLPFLAIISFAFRGVVLLIVAALVVIAIAAGAWRLSFETRQRMHRHH